MPDNDEERPRARPVARRPRDDDEVEDRPRRRRRDGHACPKCGSGQFSNGPWPWYLGTVGAMMCQAMVCDDCGHEFDLKKPHANLATRKRNLAILINGIGLLGILTVGALLY